MVQRIQHTKLNELFHKYSLAERKRWMRRLLSSHADTQKRTRGQGKIISGNNKLENIKLRTNKSTSF